MSKRKNNTGKRLLNKFLQVFLTTFAILVLVVGVGTAGFIYFARQSVSAVPDDSSSLTGEVSTDGTAGNDEGSLAERKMTTFAIFGVDRDGYRTDVTMIAFFNHEDASFDIVSVPRDTQVKLPDDLYAKISARRSDVEQIMKINEVPAYVTNKVNETSVQVLESGFGIEIDYYINLNLDAFRFIVDQVGEIEVEVPMDMYYQDPVQNLNINLKKGIQTINGAQAEQLIRYREGYGTGDIGRIEMQHAFMKAFVEQLLTTKNRLNMVNLMSAFMLKVDTDFTEALDYLIFLDKISADNITLHMLPGHAESTERSYYIYDYDASKALFDEILNKAYASETEGEAVETGVDVEPTEIINVKSLAISVQNGTSIIGLAGRYKDILEKDGFNVIEAVNYPDKPVKRSKIVVPNEVVFEAIKGYLNDPEMQIDETMMDKEVQVILILGQDAED